MVICLEWTASEMTYIVSSGALNSTQTQTQTLSGVRCRLAYDPADATATHCLLLQIGVTFLVLAHLGSPRQKWVCVTPNNYLIGTASIVFGAGSK